MECFIAITRPRHKVTELQIIARREVGQFSLRLLFTMRMPVTHERNVIRLWSIIVINRALSAKQTWETGMNTGEERMITRYVSVIFLYIYMHATRICFDVKG